MAEGITGYFDLYDNSYGITFRVRYAQTYDVATNKSTVEITSLWVKCSAYFGITHYLNGSITINGTKAVTLSSNGVTISAKNEFYKVSGTLGSVDVTHNNDGSKSVSISASVKAYNGESKLRWSVSGSETVTLTTIPRASSLTVSNGTLGTQQTLKITENDSSFTHKLTYKCGSVSGYLLGDDTTTSTALNRAWTPPFELASQNTTGTSVSVKFTLYTYTSGGVAVGSVSKTVTMSIPSEVKPSCSLTVTDPTGYFDKFGGYVQGRSKLSVSIKGTTSHGSPIASYKATANGVSYTKQSFTTGVLASSGSQTISATVTDERGRTSNKATETIDVLAYSAPKITKLSVNRCNADGTENDIGAYVKATYSFSITSLDGKNGRGIKLQYKKSSESTYTTVTLTAAYSATNATHVFAADDGSSYDITLAVNDSFTTSKRSTSVSTAAVIMHFRADGTGMGIGKVSEKTKTLDMGWNMELNGNNILNFGVTGASLKSSRVETDAELETLLQTVYGAMSGATAKLVYWTGYPSATSHGWFGILSKSSDNNGSIKAWSANLTGSLVFKVKFSGAWQPLEWQNPPMDIDVEYRTTERYQGKPVYAKCISIGMLPSNAETTTPHGISNSKNFVAVWGHSGRYYFPTQWNDDKIGTINIYATSTNVYVRTTEAWDNYVAYVTIKYTKTTD